MKVTQNIISVLALVSVNAVIAAPVPVEDVARIVAKAAEPEPVPADYGSYGKYGSYGSYAGAPIPPTAGSTATPATPASGYGSYGTYAPPAGGYGSYGAYKKIRDFIGSLFA